MDFLGIKTYFTQKKYELYRWSSTPLNITYTKLDRLVDTIQAIAIIVLAVLVYVK